MSLLVSKIAPIYFPLLHSNFPGTTNGRAACEPDDQPFVQIWSEQDTLNFQIFNSTDFTKDYGVIIGADFYAGSTTGNGYYDFSIPMLPYLDSVIEPLLVEGTAIGAVIAELDQASRMRVFQHGDPCIDCSSLIAYNGNCVELQVWYGLVAGNPSFTHYLRIPAAIEYDSGSNTIERYKGSSGSWATQFAEGDSVFRHYTEFLPLWMLQKLNLACLSSRVWIEGGEMMLQSPYRKGEQDRLTNMYRCDARFIQKKSPYMVATCC